MLLKWLVTEEFNLADIIGILHRHNCVVTLLLLSNIMATRQEYENRNL